MFVFTVYIIYNIYVYVCMHVYMYVICMLYQHYVHHLYSFIHHHPAGHQLRHVILQSWGGVATWGRAGFGDDPRRSKSRQRGRLLDCLELQGLGNIPLRRSLESSKKHPFHTVDGPAKSESPVDRSLIPILIGFQPSFWWCRISSIFLPSTVDSNSRDDPRSLGISPPLRHSLIRQACGETVRMLWRPFQCVR